MLEEPVSRQKSSTGVQAIPPHSACSETTKSSPARTLGQ